MIDSRKDQLIAFVKSIILEDEIMLLSLNGDASFRRYFRVANTKLIAVDAPPATQKNKEFLEIDKALIEAHIKAPTVIASDLDNGFMLLEDLGDVTFAQVAKDAVQESWYLKAVDLLPSIASISNSINLPKFNEEFIQTELSLFETWMLNKRLNVVLSSDEKSILSSAFSYIEKEIQQQPYVAMHRDFHSRNLMVCSDKLAVIDFQDMVFGPICYDLASLVYDCYINLDPALIIKLIEITYENYRKAGLIQNMSFYEFNKFIQITSLQRHLKVLGIFCRLSIRDGKNAYLKDLPRVIQYVLKECESDVHFSKLKMLIEKYVVGNF